MNSCGVELFRCSGYFLALSALSGSLSSSFFPNFGGVADLLVRTCAYLILEPTRLADNVLEQTNFAYDVLELKRLAHKKESSACDLRGPSRNGR